MSFAAQLAARAEATKRSSASNIDADALDSTSSISDSIKSRSASTTTNISSSSNSNSRQASNSETTKSQSGWKPKQHHTIHNTNTTTTNNKQKKKLVPISDSDDALLQPSYMNMTEKSQSSQPQDVKNSNNNNITSSSSSETIAARISSSSVVNEESTIMKSPRIFDQQEQSDKPLTSTSTSKPDTTIMSPLRSTKKASKSDSNSNSSCNIDSIKQQADRYKLENTKLRKEALLLKARLEQQHNKIDTPDQSRDSTLPTNSCLTPPCIPRSEEAADIIDTDNGSRSHQHHSNNNNNSNNLSTSMLQLKAQYKQLRRLSVERIHGLEQMSLLTPPPTELLQKMNSLKLLEEEEEEPMGRGRGGRRTPENANELVDENVRLTQLLIDIGQLEELAKLRKNVGTDTKNVPQSTQLKSIIETSVEKDNTIQLLQTKLRDIDEELKDVTELKNAEIAVLRKQLDRAEHKQLHDINKGVVAPVGNTASMMEKEEWTKEREGYRDEIRRLNIELSMLKEKTIRCSASIDEDEKELIDYSQYNGGSGSGGGTVSSATATNNEVEQQLDSSDISSLQSIIAMMRQTIDQNSREKHELEQRLEEEQQRSQDELQAFAKTLEGVDDLRQSAENMSREIRRIKVKGYRPTRSDLFGGGASSSIGASEGFGELTRAVEASESMADAIRLIEGQNDAMEERRRMDLVVKNTPMKQGRNETSRKHYPGGLTPLPDDDDDGFLSFWNKGTGDNDDDNDDNSAAGPKKERKKKKKSKKKKSDGSVLTSFF